MSINKKYKSYIDNRKDVPRIKINVDDIPNQYSKVAIIVPYRNDILNERKIQLDNFVEYYHNFLPNIQIFIIEQSNDGRKFNRGALLNIGYLISKSNNFDRYIFHDVDLLSPDQLSKVYTFNPSNPVHIGRLWREKYKFYNFVGGIISFDKSTYEKINGYPNTFWGWGGEDDALGNRLVATNTELILPLSDSYQIVEMKHTSVADNKTYTNINKKENILRDLKNWKNDGINSINYDIVKIQNLSYDNVIKVTININ